MHELATTPKPYGTSPPPEQAPTSQSLQIEDQDSLARVSQAVDAQAPASQQTRKAKTRQDSLPSHMDFKIDFDDTAGFQTRGKKSAAKKKAQQAAFWDEPEGNGDGTANGEGGGADGSGGAGSGAGGAGGDDGNNGGGDDDDWTLGFSSAKTKKKTKKKEEEEQKRKEEEEAAAANTNSLNWADDMNDAAGDDDWTMGFTTAGKKGKKGKKVGDSQQSAVSQSNC